MQQPDVRNAGFIRQRLGKCRLFVPKAGARIRPGIGRCPTANVSSRTRSPPSPDCSPCSEPPFANGLRPQSACQNTPAPRRSRGALTLCLLHANCGPSKDEAGSKAAFARHPPTDEHDWASVSTHAGDRFDRLRHATLVRPARRHPSGATSTRRGRGRAKLPVCVCEWTHYLQQGGVPTRAAGVTGNASRSRKVTNCVTFGASKCGR